MVISSIIYSILCLYVFAYYMQHIHNHHTVCSAMYNNKGFYRWKYGGYPEIKRPYKVLHLTFWAISRSQSYSNMCYWLLRWLFELSQGTRGTVPPYDPDLKDMWHILCLFISLVDQPNPAIEIQLVYACNLFENSLEQEKLGRW